MPDITMCASETCRKARKCYRNPRSGTKSSEWRQSWFALVDDDTDERPCLYFLPKGGGDDGRA